MFLSIKFALACGGAIRISISELNDLGPRLELQTCPSCVATSISKYSLHIIIRQTSATSTFSVRMSVFCNLTHQMTYCCLVHVIYSIECSLNTSELISICFEIILMHAVSHYYAPNNCR